MERLWTVRTLAQEYEINSDPSRMHQSQLFQALPLTSVTAAIKANS